MPATVVSKFNLFYFLFGSVGAIFFITLAGRVSFFAIFGEPANRLGIIVIALFLILITTVFFYFFSRGWKTVSIGPDGILVNYLVFKKQLVIQYAEITSIYKPVYAIGSRGNPEAVTSNFVIEFGERKISFSGSEYQNYNELCAAVYNYKFGFDRHRSQY